MCPPASLAGEQWCSGIHPRGPFPRERSGQRLLIDITVAAFHMSFAVRSPPRSASHDRLYTMACPVHRWVGYPSIVAPVRSQGPPRDRRSLPIVAAAVESTRRHPCVINRLASIDRRLHASGGPFSLSSVGAPSVQGDRRQRSLRTARSFGRPSGHARLTTRYTTTPPEDSIGCERSINDRKQTRGSLMDF